MSSASSALESKAISLFIITVSFYTTAEHLVLFHICYALSTYRDHDERTTGNAGGSLSVVWTST